MKTTLPNFLLAASERSVFYQPAMNPWWMVLIFTAAGAMIFYLYRAQQRIASQRVVRVLTVLRMLLVASLLLLLLQPGYRWKHTRRSAGTLWVMLDASQSMASTDPQSSAVERLRWADALDYLPADKRTLRLDRAVAGLACLRDDLARLQTPGVFGGTDESAARTVDAFRESLRAWQRDIDEAANQLSREALLKPPLGAISDSLRKVSGLAAGGLEAGTAAASVPDAIKLVGWQKLETELTAVVKSLGPVADEVDRDFLSRNTDDPGVQEALARAAKLTRSELAVHQLTRASKRSPQSLKDLWPQYRVRVASFSEKARPLSSGEVTDLTDTFKTALDATGPATSLSETFQFVGEQAVPDEPTSLLLISDGRQNAGASPEAAARQLAAQQVRVYCVALGSDQAAVDASVDDIDAPSWIYKDDKLTARGTIRSRGMSGKPVSAEFWRGGTKLETKKITPKSADDAQVVTFDDARHEVGVFDYQVRVDGGATEENKRNNRQSFRSSVRAEPLRLLLVEDQPRWEYRHLVSYLSRDRSVKLQTILLRPTRIDGVTPPAPVKASPVNDRTEAQLLPSTPEEWAAFDVIILGDVSPDAVGSDSQKAIVAAVRNAGKTLILIAGPRSMPGSYLNAPLDEVLPVAAAGGWPAEALAGHLRNGFHTSLTRQGAGSVLAQLGADAAANADLWAALPPWYWHSEQTVAKPAATVLASIVENESLSPTAPVGSYGNSDVDPSAVERRRALVATTTVGLGRVLYLASDETWRLRQVNGQNLQDRFWGQVLRWSSGNQLPAGGEFARFGADKSRYNEGDAVTLTAKLSQPDHTAMSGQKFEVIARRQADQPPATSLASQPSDAPAVDAKIVARTEFAEVPDAPGLYRAVVKGLPAGDVELSLAGNQIDGLLKDVTDDRLKSVPVQIAAIPTLEQKNTDADRQKLADIARAGGGVLVDGPYAGLLAKYIPRPKIDEVRYEQLGLFGDRANYYTKLSHWIFLGIFATLISAEWILRKVAGLV